MFAGVWNWAMQTSPLEAHLLTPSAVVIVDARNSALVFKIRRSRKASRRVRGLRSSAERRLLYGDGFKVRVSVQLKGGGEEIQATCARCSPTGVPLPVLRFRPRLAAPFHPLQPRMIAARAN